mgnify:CR=1 FL=1
MMQYNNPNRQNLQRNTYIREILPEQIPEDYVEAADQVMQKIADEKRYNQITTSKIRNILSLISESLCQLINELSQKIIDVANLKEKNANNMLLKEQREKIIGRFKFA